MRRQLPMVVVLLATGLSGARADLIAQFAGFNSVWEINVSGLDSSYGTDTRTGRPVDGTTTGSGLALFGPSRVSYPSGIGQVPSPGGSTGRNFDQGVLGVKMDGGDLVFQLATALNPQTGYYYSGWNSWYSEGDLFVDVADSAGTRHYALLNTWARNPAGNPLSLNGGYYSAAQAFHLTGGAARGSLEGHLIEVLSNSQVSATGGTGAYTSSNAPAGLDLRAFASGGTDLGSASLALSQVTDGGRAWYLQSWTISGSSLSSDPQFNIGLHATASCGNDQIGARYPVPEPVTGLSMVLLAALGFARRR